MPQENRPKLDPPIFITILILISGILGVLQIYDYQSTRPKITIEKGVEKPQEPDGWRTYRNDKLGFEIQIPDGLTVRENSTTSIYFISQETEERIKQNDCLGKGQCNTETLDRDIEFTNIDNYEYKDFVSKSYSIDLGSFRWLRYERDGLTEGPSFLLENGGKVFNFQTYYSSNSTEETLKKILSTFKFTK